MVTSGESKGGKGDIGVGNYEVQTILYKINKLQVYIVQHREYSQYFIMSIHAV